MRHLLSLVGALFNYLIFPLVFLFLLLTPVGTILTWLYVEDSTSYTMTKNQSTGAIALAVGAQMALCGYILCHGQTIADFLKGHL